MHFRIRLLETEWKEADEYDLYDEIRGILRDINPSWSVTNRHFMSKLARIYNNMGGNDKTEFRVRAYYRGIKPILIENGLYK